MQDLGTLCGNLLILDNNGHYASVTGLRTSFDATVCMYDVGRVSDMSTNDLRVCAASRQCTIVLLVSRGGLLSCPVGAATRGGDAEGFGPWLLSCSPQPNCKNNTGWMEPCPR